MSQTNTDIDAFLDKVKKLEKGEKLDLSSDEDLSIAIMNLISIEEHLFFTFNKTNNDKYLDLLNEVRDMRKGLLKRIIKDYEGEVWCISKHLLASSMRLMEVGTKALTKGNKTEAANLFKKSHQLYSLFWGINLKLINTEEMKNIKGESDTINLISEDSKPVIKAKTSILDKLGIIVQKAINCCKE